MRSVGLDLGARHIAWCEVVDGAVTRRGSVSRLSELETLLGPNTAPAQVAFEASREGWHVHDVLVAWGKKPWMLDTTRIRRIGAYAVDRELATELLSSVLVVLRRVAELRLDVEAARKAGLLDPEAAPVRAPAPEDGAS